MTVTVDEVLNKLYFSATDERDKGDKLERLMASYLTTDPEYAHRFSQRCPPVVAHCRARLTPRTCWVMWAARPQANA